MGAKGTSVKKSWCFFCKGRCSVKVFVDGDRLVKIEPDPEVPGTQGEGCNGTRYKNTVDWFYSLHRLNYPLKRMGRRGENKWKQVTWDEALDEIFKTLAELREKHGAETLSVSAGDAWGNSEEYKTRFLSLFGSPNIFGPSPICMGPRSLVCEAIFGWYPQMSVRAVTKCVVALGANMGITRPAVWKEYMNARKNGARLIVIDPRFSEISAAADLWLQLKPGTDSVVLLAMIDHIIKIGIYDKHFVCKWCHGFEQMALRAAEYPVDRAEKISGVSTDQIREAAEIYASSKPAAIVEGMGVEQQTNGAQIIHARCILAGITGNLDIEGGEELHGGFAHTGFVTDRQIELLNALPQSQRRKQIAYDKFRLHSWPGQELLEKYMSKNLGEKGSVHWYTGQAHQPSVYRAILSEDPYPIKAMISSASNPMVSHSNTSMVYRALKKLDLYVVFDLMMNPSAQLADYVLPAASWLEREHLWSYLGYKDTLFGCHATVPVRTSNYDRRDDFTFWRELGVRLGQEDYWPWKSLKEACDERMKNCEISFDELCEKGYWRILEPGYQKYESQSFNTPTGKIELYSTILEEFGYDPLPYYEAPPLSQERTPDISKEYPFILINGSRIRQFMHSMWREVPSVRKLHAYPRVQIHPDTAISLNIENGEWVWIETPVGRIRQCCMYFDGIKPNVIHAEGQWWYPELPGEEPFLYGIWLSNVNVILNDDPESCNEITGGWPLRHTLCKVYK